MEIYIENQLIIMLYSAILGLIFGAGYDIIRIVHLMLGELRLRGLLVFLLDLAYMLVLAVCISVFTYVFNYGDLRMFLLLPMGAGFAAYHVTVGRVVMLCSEAIIRLIRAVIRYALVLPLRLALRLLRRLAVWLLRHTAVPLLRFLGDRRRCAYTEKQKKQIVRQVRL